MEYQKFSDAYRNSKVDVHHEFEDPEIGEIVGQLSSLSGQLEERIVSFLDGGEGMTMNFVMSYLVTMYDIVGKTQPIEKRLKSLPIEEREHEDFLEMITTLNSHYMTLAAGGLLTSLQPGITRVSKDVITRTQIMLATGVMTDLPTLYAELLDGNLLVEKQIVPDKPENGDGDVSFTQKPSSRALKGYNMRARPYFLRIQGSLNEFDTFITVLEMCKQHPGLVVIPAHGAFEHASYGKRKNVDFLLIDLEEREVHGLQTKLSITQADVAFYNSDLVTLIDGRVDLDNSLPMRVPGISDPVNLSWPGLIATHFLQGQKNVARTLSSTDVFGQPVRRGRAFQIDPSLNPVMRAKLAAEAMTLGTRDRTQEAVRRIAGRALRGLYSQNPDAADRRSVS